MPRRFQRILKPLLIVLSVVAFASCALAIWTDDWRWLILFIPLFAMGIAALGLIQRRMLRESRTLKRNIHRSLERFGSQIERTQSFPLPEPSVSSADKQEAPSSSLDLAMKELPWELQRALRPYALLANPIKVLLVSSTSVCQAATQIPWAGASWDLTTFPVDHPSDSKIWNIGRYDLLVLHLPNDLEICNESFLPLSWLNQSAMVVLTPEQAVSDARYLRLLHGTPAVLISRDPKGQGSYHLVARGYESDPS